MKKIILLLLFAALASCGSSRTSVPLTTQEACRSAVDTSLSSATYKAGISVAVYSGKYDTWTYAAGKASESTAMSSSTPAYAFSITKTVLSALILKQIESKYYTLTSKASDLLSESDKAVIKGLTNAGGIYLDATVAQLLSHTSRMKDYATNTGVTVSLVEAMGVSSNAWDPISVLSLVPGTLSISKDYKYASTNYILLGMIAEKQGGGKKLNTLLSETFFSDLNLSAVLAPQDSIPGNIAAPYDQYALVNLIDSSYGIPASMYGNVAAAVSFLYSTIDMELLTGRAAWAAGGIIATADNLAKWGYELYSSEGKAVSTAVRAQLLASAPDEKTYGYGVSKTLFTYSDGTAGSFYGHSGDGPGGKTILAYDPDLDMSIAIILNASANYTALMTTGSTSDAALGLVDRKELVKTIFRTFKADSL